MARGTEETGMARLVGPRNPARPEYEGGALPPHHSAQFLVVNKRPFQPALNEHTAIRSLYLCCRIRCGPEEERILDVVPREDGARNSG